MGLEPMAVAGAGLLSANNIAVAKRV